MCCACPELQTLLLTWEVAKLSDNVTEISSLNPPCLSNS
jgi:hypothetical protein